jgi:hypothetical protein
MDQEWVPAGNNMLAREGLSAILLSGNALPSVNGPAENDAK